MTSYTSTALRLIACGIALVLLASVGCGVAAGAGAPATYTARGLLEVEPPWSRPAAGLSDAGPAIIPPEYFTMYLNSTVATVKSPRVLQAALDQLKGDQKLYIGADAAARLGKDLRVEHVAGTFNIAVSLSASDRLAAQTLVREVMAQYLSLRAQERMEADSEKRAGLVATQAELAKQAGTLAQDLESRFGESTSLAPDNSNNEQMARLTILMRQLTETQIALSEANSAWEQLKALREESDKTRDFAALFAAFPEILESVQSDPRLAFFQQELDRRQVDAAVAEATGKATDVTSFKKVAETLQNLLNMRKSELLGQAFAGVASRLKARYDRLRAMEADLLNKTNEARAAAISAAKAAAQYRTREAEYRRVQALLSTVTDALERMKLSAALSRPTIRVRVWPEIPLDADAPAREK